MIEYTTEKALNPAIMIYLVIIIDEKSSEQVVQAPGM